MTSASTCRPRWRCSSPIWGYRPLLDISDEEAREQLARAAVMALSYVAQSARGVGDPGRAAVADRPVRHDHRAVHDALARRTRPAATSKAVDAYFVSAAEHGMNASTFTARVIASTGADVAAAMSGADRRDERSAARRGARPACCR